MKAVLKIQRADTPHWVGDGFPVRTLFSYNDLAPHISPFLLLDYAGPTEFSPTTEKRGVGSHPHRGFETVTLVYDGQVEHRDSAGGGGVISKDDVQWMTAASGLVHEEFHGKDFAKSGGPFEMVQLWVNLPQKDKLAKPRYQGLSKESIPVIELPNSAGVLRVIAGEYGNQSGPAKTFSAINMWDLRLHKNTSVELKVTPGHTAVVFIASGSVTVSQQEKLGDAEMAILEPKGESVYLQSHTESKVLFLGGQPLNEPIAGYGPFVMNTFKEIATAFDDFDKGKMGTLDPIEGSEK